MKNMTKNKNKLYTLITLVIITGFLTSLQFDTVEYSYQIPILERSAIYAVATVSMNLLTGFTDLFFLGQAGFMAIGTYVTVIFTTPVGFRTNVYYVNGISPVIVNIQLSILAALLLGGLAATAMVAPIGIPILCLKSDYLVITTLSFSKIIRASIAAPMFDTITDGSYGLKNTLGFPNIFAAFGLAALCIAPMVLLTDSSYGRAFESIREGEVVAQSMGINLFYYKELFFVISSFFTGVGGRMLAMFIRSVDSKTFQVTLTYDTLLTMVLGGIGSVTGNVTSTFLVTVGRELLYFFDDPLTIAGVSAPLFRSGFHMVIFSIPLMAVVLFCSRGIMGSHKLPQDGLFRLIRGIPGKFRRGRKKPSSAKEGGIH